MKIPHLLTPACWLLCATVAFTQPPAPKANDTTTPLHLLKPDYPVPYGQPKTDEVAAVLNRVYTYLDSVTPAELIDRQTGQPITEVKPVQCQRHH